jgi:hypothetical protein
VEGRGPRLADAAGAHARAAQPLPAPPARARGRRGGPAEAARRQGAAARVPAASVRPRRSTSRLRVSARSASSTWTWSTPRTCSARSSTTSIASATARSTRPRRRSRCSTPTSNVVTYDRRLDASNIEEIIAGYDVIVDGADNFPVRYMLNDASVKLGIPVVHGSIFRFEGQVHGVRPQEARRTATCSPNRRPPETGAELRRGRRARRAAGHHRHHPGGRDPQADPRRR